MRKVVFSALSILIMLAGVLYSGQLSPAQADSPKILAFNSMVGVPQALTGTQSQAPLRGISGGDHPGRSLQRMVRSNPLVS